MMLAVQNFGLRSACRVDRRWLRRGGCCHSTRACGFPQSTARVSVVLPLATSYSAVPVMGLSTHVASEAPGASTAAVGAHRLLPTMDNRTLYAAPSPTLVKTTLVDPIPSVVGLSARPEVSRFQTGAGRSRFASQKLTAAATPAPTSVARRVEAKLFQSKPVIASAIRASSHPQSPVVHSMPRTLSGVTR